jgi:hypothetical protein
MKPFTLWSNYNLLAQGADLWPICSPQSFDGL